MPTPGEMRTAVTRHVAEIQLEAGHLVMTGALHAAVPMRAGDVFRADFDRLGPVTVRVVE